MSYIKVKSDPLLGINRSGPIEVSVFDRPKNLISPSEVNAKTNRASSKEKIFSKLSSQYSPVKLKSSKPPWMSRNFDLVGFTPEFSPYIPNLVTVLINLIEKELIHEVNWHKAYQSVVQYDSEETQVLCKIIFSNYTKVDMINELCNKSAGFLTCILRLFLEMFKTKLVHLNVEEMLELSQRPLYDKYLRPDTSMRRVFMKVFLKSPRIKIDTLSFIILHINKCCYYSANTSYSRSVIAECLGPYIISFDTSRKFFSRDVDVRVALLEFIFELFNNATWNYLSQQETQKEFYSTQALQRILARKDRISNTDFSEIELSKVESCHHEGFKLIKELTHRDLFPVLNDLQDQKEKQNEKTKSDRNNGRPKSRVTTAQSFLQRKATVPRLRFVISSPNQMQENVALSKSIHAKMRPQLEFCKIRPSIFNLNFVKNVDPIPNFTEKPSKPKLILK